MRLRKAILSGRRSRLLAGIALAAVAGSAARAADVAETVAPVPPVLTYFHGGFEAGGRFVDRPPSGFGRAPNGDFLTPSQTQSRAKFEEYGEVRSAPMLDWINLQFGTTDGRYAVDFWGKNVGLDNQSYWLDIAKPGEHYLTFGYDETPRLFSTSAKTLFRGTPTFLTVPDAVQAALQAQLPNAAANTAAGATARRNIETIINGNAAGPLTLKVDREKAIVAYRYTPTPNLEFRADYSREERTGSRLNSINWGWGTAANPRPTNFVEVPYPINDLTQNASFTGQYTGLSFWDLPFTANLRYSVSLYENAIPFFLAENPFCITCDPLAGTNRGPNLLRQSENPDNQAHALRFSTGIDLPWKSRYMGTFQYQRMRQDDPFINTAINGLVPAAYPAASLDARTNTVLANNVLTTQITPELKSTLRYRYYDVDNVSPILTFTNYIYGDSGFSTGAQNPRIAIPIQYTKENASGEITWRPLRWMNLGAVYGWERYDRDRRSVDVTDEHSGKIYVDANPVDWMRARASFLYGERRYGTYDEFNFEEKPRGILTEGQLAQMRKFDVANRNRKKAEAQVEITPFQLVTITPNFGLRYDDFPDFDRKSARRIAGPLLERRHRGWAHDRPIGTRARRLQLRDPQPEARRLLRRRPGHRHPGQHVAQRHRAALQHADGGARLEGHPQQARVSV